MIRIVSWNIRKAVGLDWRRDPERILRVLDETGAQIAILQEADKRVRPRHPAIPAAALRDAGWHAVPTDALTPSIGHHGNAVLLRPGWRIGASERIDLPGLEPRGALAVSLTGVAPIGIVGAHLGLRRRDRVLQLAALRTHLDDLGPATLLAGDLNEWRRTPLPLPPGWTWHVPPPTFHASRPSLSLDRIATGPALRLTELEVHRSPAARRASDHLPVTATVAVTGGVRPVAHGAKRQH
ncbi:endonuclease/exonuclease/phosphatase family protein [Jannaschia formosa]|uniref:endonuclease/exonuclease/phosphatase family protein n=1 Tax=Jannaschia formosa TaxID=2259592 RepID=UPI000E1B67DF|nr:endonuclease/exonuclease/phosphatase family protein [Jannaschia formosa]TFL16073.1 hypothetical protein DR046_22010 [Jannaschia formosa]